jgi:hypothetical protein
VKDTSKMVQQLNLYMDKSVTFSVKTEAYQGILRDVNSCYATIQVRIKQVNLSMLIHVCLDSIDAFSCSSNTRPWEED